MFKRKKEFLPMMTPIRFAGEWANYPNAIADTLTKNESFLYLVKIYKAMGVDNHAFPLALHRPVLQGIDPHHTDLPAPIKKAIFHECKENLWFYLRSVQRVPQPGGDPIPYVANRANIAMSWALLVNIDFVLIMPRQCGKSVGVDCVMTWILHFHCRNTLCQLITKDIKLRRANIKRLKKFREALPPYLIMLSDKDADNTEEITYLKRGNVYSTAVGRADVDGADNVGRGLTGPILQADEPPYTPNFHISFNVAASSATAARDFAKANGLIYCNLFTTTAGKLDTPEGAYCFRLFNSGTHWSERYLDAHNYDHLVDMIRANSNGERLIFNGTFSHLQIGKTNRWLKDAIINADCNRQQALRDYLNQWVSVNSESPLDIAVFDAISMADKTPLFTDLTSGNYLVRWYVEKKEIPSVMHNRPTVLSLDSSDAVGADANGITISTLDDMRVICCAEVKEASLFRLAEWIFEMLLAYPLMTWVFENKSSGKSLCDIVASKLIAAGINPFKRIFNRIVDEQSKNIEVYKRLVEEGHGCSESEYVHYKAAFGFNTTGQSREFLYRNVFYRATSSCGHLVSDSALCKQLTSLAIIKGRIDHPPGGHDDLVFSWLLGHWFATNAKFTRSYGIQPGIVYSLVIDDFTRHGGNNDAVVKEDLAKKQQVTAIKQQLAGVTNELMRHALNKQMERIIASISDPGKKAQIMDEVREEAKPRGLNLDW